MAGSETSGMFVDTSRWPLVINTQRGAITDEQVEVYLGELSALHKRSEPFAMVLDVRAAVPMNSKQRKMLSDWMNAHPSEMKRLLGIAFVEASAMMHGAMQAMFWVMPPSYPYIICRDLEPALAWAQERVGTTRKAHSA